MTLSHPFLALHGNLGSPQDWLSLGLGNLTAVDLWAWTDYDFESFADKLAESTSCETKHPILAGYSLGGRLALHALARHPESWGGAVIASAHPGLADLEERRLRRIRDEEWAERVTSWDWTDFLSAWNTQSVLGPPSLTWQHRQAALLQRREQIAMAFRQWSLGIQNDLREVLSTYQRPVLWIVGEQDASYRRLGEEMEDMISHFSLKIVPGCGHRLLDEAPEILRDLICDWMSRMENGNNILS